jgi:hypothetical protein
MKDENFEIHLQNLPEDKIYIKLKEEFRKDLFNKAILEVGSYIKLCKFLNRDVGKFISGKYRTSLKIINRILTTFFLKNKVNLWKQIENNLEEITCGGIFGPGQALSIFNPCFPIKLSPELVNLLGHIVGDGTIFQEGSMYGIIEYFNSEKILLENFAKNTTFVFGNAEFKYNPKRKYAIRLPKVVGIILENFTLIYDS